MKVLLIQAAVSDTPFPPIGILYIAGVLERAGFTVRVMHPGPGDVDYIGEVVSFSPGVVGFSLTTPQVSRVAEIHSVIRKHLSEVFTICGGPHATVCSRDTLERMGFDAVVVGEGELTALELCTALETGKDITSIEGLLIRKESGTVYTGDRALIPDLDELPFPARHLIDMNAYLNPPGIIRGYPSGPSTAVFSGRGCAFDCIFCNSKSMFRRKIRKRSVQNVLKEIEGLHSDYGIEAVFFPDEAFISGKKWVEEFCEAIAGTGIVWACQSRVDINDPGLFKTMRQAGCVQVEFGVESGSAKVLEILRKQSTPDQVSRAFMQAKSAGLRTLATFMVGNPGEEMEDIKKTETLARKIKADYTAFFYLVPYPGTELFTMAIENAWIPPDPDYSSGWFIRQTEYPVMSINFTPVELAKIRGRLQNRFLLRNYLGYLRSWNFMSRIIISVIMHPITIMSSLFRALRTRRMDHLLETAFVLMNRS